MSSEDHGPTRQRFMEGTTGGVMKGGDFGIGPLPGTKRYPPPDSEETMGRTLKDSERCCPGAIEGGRRSMGATAAPDHGPHHHRDPMAGERGMRPHHVK
jgi:hypothetical protein